MEHEFLLGVDFNLYIETTYASWLNPLKGLVLAKERNARRLLRGFGMRVPSSARRGMGSGREGRFWHPHQPHMEITHMAHIPDLEVPVLQVEHSPQLRAMLQQWTCFSASAINTSC
jgi:hypothetical protein